MNWPGWQRIGDVVWCISFHPTLKAFGSWCNTLCTLRCTVIKVRHCVKLRGRTTARLSLEVEPTANFKLYHMDAQFKQSCDEWCGPAWRRVRRAGPRPEDVAGRVTHRAALNSRTRYSKIEYQTHELCQVSPNPHLTKLLSVALVASGRCRESVRHVMSLRYY